MLSKIKENSILLLYMCTLICMYVFVVTANPYINYIRYLFTFFLTAYILFKQSKIIVTKSMLFFVGCFVVHTIVFTFLIKPDYISGHVMNYGKDLILFLLFVFFMAQYVWQNSFEKEFLFISQVVTSVFMMYCYFTHFTSIAPIKFLPALLTGGYRIRFSLGFSSYNEAAFFGLETFILAVMTWRELCGNKSLLKKNWNIYEVFLVFSGFVGVMVMLSAQTRGALISMLIFWIMTKVMNRENIFGINLRKINWKFYVVIFLGVFAAYFYYVFFLSTSRSAFLHENFNVFLKNGDLMTGLGYLPFNAFYTDMYLVDTAPLDCYYVYILCATGIIGFVLIMCAILFLLLRSIWLYCNFENNTLRNQCIVLYVIMLYISFSESLFIADLSPESYIYWIMLLLLLNGKKHGKICGTEDLNK